MRKLGKKTSLLRLSELREDFRREISTYERSAESCTTCVTPGACCLDEHFVNVRVSRLESEALRLAIAGLETMLQAQVKTRAEAAVALYKLDEVLDTSLATYACPLFEKGVGCLVHNTAKPLPCIAHACYSKAADLPPDELLDQGELAVERLNRQTYAASSPLIPIPLAILAQGDETSRQAS